MTIQNRDRRHRKFGDPAARVGAAGGHLGAAQAVHGIEVGSSREDARAVAGDRHHAHVGVAGQLLGVLGQPFQRVQSKGIVAAAQREQRKAVAMRHVDLGRPRRCPRGCGGRCNVIQFDVEGGREFGLRHAPIALDTRLSGAIVQLEEPHRWASAQSRISS